MKTRKNILVQFFIFIFAIVLINGCNSDSTEPVVVYPGEISMTHMYVPATISFAKVNSTMALDSIKITRARFLINDIKYKTQSDSANFRSKPIVLEMNMTGSVQNISAANVPYGIYSRIEFDVHRAISGDVNGLTESEKTTLNDFLTNDKYSTIIEGTVYRSGILTQFTYRSKLNVKQKINLSPELVINESLKSVNVSMIISPLNWFTSSNGLLLDPTDTKNEDNIDNNLKESIHIIKDNNKDGKAD